MCNKVLMPVTARYAAMVLLKQEIEGISDLDKMAELLVRLLCAVPGWGEKNVQVGNGFLFLS